MESQDETRPDKPVPQDYKPSTYRFSNPAFHEFIACINPQFHSSIKLTECCAINHQSRIWSTINTGSQQTTRHTGE
jgi:hypothetical protein